MKSIQQILVSTVIVSILMTHGILWAQADDIAELEPEPFAGMGIMLGELTDSSVITQVRLTTTDKPVNGDIQGSVGVVEFQLWIAGDTREPLIQRTGAFADQDYIARVDWSSLAPATQYVCSTRIGRTEEFLRAGPVAHFKTLPGKASAAPAKFVVVTGMNYAKFHGDKRIDRKQHLVENNRALPEPYKGPDKHLGYPALASILKLKPDFFVGTGDNVYYDTPDNPRAMHVAELRQKWHEQFVQRRYVELFAAVPTYWEVDDHDYRIDDGDNSGDYLPSPAIARAILLEQLPLAARRTAVPKTYRTVRVNQDLQVWFTENRMYRSDNAIPDGPEKTIWGSTQKRWLKRTLKSSGAKFKIVVSPTPMIGPDDARKTDNHTNIGGFRHERDEFFAWLKTEELIGNGFFVVCGDRHWQYHSVHPTGVEEFSCGALVDANSRLGRPPGDPKSTDPDAKIKQVYAQKEPSGGFLTIAVGREEAEVAKLRFTYYDEKGVKLHEVVK